MQVCKDTLHNLRAVELVDVLCQSYYYFDVLAYHTVVLSTGCGGDLHGI